MANIESYNLVALRALLNSSHEVNQELGIATIKAIGIPKDNWQEWHRLMSSSIQKLRFCLAYELGEELKIIKLTDFSTTERAYLSIIESFPNLEKLSLTSQMYMEYDWILQWKRLPALKILNLVRNKLRQFPKVLSEAQQLTHLYLSHNRMLKLDASIGNLAKLQKLALRRNRLQKLPTQLAALQNLKSLDVSSNHLQKLEGGLFQWEQLEELNLSFNDLRKIPKQISRLKQLKILNVSGNKIDDLPIDLFESSKLEVLKIKTTPLAKNQDWLNHIRMAYPSLQLQC